MTSRKVLLVPWLPAPVWKDFPMSKGLGHHRTPVGIILAANQKLYCVLENNSVDQARIRLLNDDRKTEGNFKITSSQPGRAATFNVGAVSVPFLDCEYLKNPPKEDRKISISYPSGSKILPIYRFGDNEDKFFQLWDSQDAEFAYIESDYIGMLLPKIDKEAARKLPGGKHLDDLIVFYDKILITYSQFIGLSFEETGTNQNVRNRFFIKADKNGFGAAYYNDSVTAVNGGSMKKFWLDINPTNWGALHEIGHGHELRNLSDETLSVMEVWNNVLAFLYQIIFLGNEMAQKAEKLGDMSLINVLRRGTEVKNWDLFQKLSFLVHMFVKAGQKSFTRFNQLTRQEYAGRTYYASGTALVEKLMHFFAIEFDIDVYPFMKLSNTKVGQEQLLEHYYVLANVAYPLNYLISDTKNLNTIKRNLGLLFETSLVTPSDLSSTKLKNDFIVRVADQSFDLTGNVLKLMDGSKTVAEENFSPIIVFKNIPVGVYKIFVEPNHSSAKVVLDNFYAVVHASKPSELVLTCTKINTPSLLPDRIKFLGLGDGYFAYLSAEPLKRLLRFYSFSSDPHSYFAGRTYATISVRNQENKVIFSKSIEGTGPALGLHDINMEGQLEIDIFHAETKGRLKCEDSMMDAIINRKSNTNTFILNDRGFQNKYMDTQKELLEKIFLNKIEFKASKIRSKISLYVKPHCLPKYNLLLAVEAFERLFRNNTISTSLRNQYKDCLPPATYSE